MKIGRVAGTVVSTINHPFFDGQRLLTCELLGPDDTPTGSYVIATDRVGAGSGEKVLILDEGSSARQMYSVATGPIRAVIVGIVDAVTMEADWTVGPSTGE